ncbi:MAG: TrkA family potassium uptake protein [Anaerolineales bacterium]|nr:TrkA family potassium uptake protein [Anaerolineales bacterium]
MNVIVVGCGRLGSELAYRLFQQGHQVTVVDSVEQSFERLKPDFRGRTVTGEALSKEVLERAGIDKADGLAAVTNSDTLNAVVAHTARTVYKVPHVVVRNYDPSLRPVLEAFGFQIVSSTAWGAQRIEELLGGAAVHTVFSAGNGEVEVYELAVSENWNGRKLGELLGKAAQCLPVALTRSGRSSLPAADTMLETGDVLIFSTTKIGIATLRANLTGKEA